MKKFAAVLGCLALTLATSAAWAGMVMTETETTTGGANPRTGQRTVMVEGNREKMVTDRNQIITDLDKGMIYILNPADKTYLQMPFPPQGPMKNMIGGPALHTKFTKTGKSRTVAGYKCEEYTGNGKFMMGEFSVVSCVSPSAPGAKDFEKFESNMMSKLKGSSLELPDSLPKGVPLSQDTTTKMTGLGNLPNLSPEMKQQLANRPPVVTKSEVTKIATQKIADSEFQVPTGYTKRDMPTMGGMMGHGMAGHPGMGGPAGPGTGAHPGMGGAPAAPAPAPAPSAGQ
jgi:hypothetical protein